MNAQILFRTDSINRYFADIKDFSVLTDSQEKMLFSRIAMGDEKAREEIICNNLRFVVSRAKKWTTNAELVADLIQAGNIGLINAVGTFDASKGYRFISYAVHMIDQEIYREVVSQSIVRQTNNMKYANKVRQIRREFFQIEHREPMAEEIAEILKDKYSIEVKDIKDILPLSVSRFDNVNIDGEDFDALESGELASRCSNENEILAEYETEDNLSQIAKRLCRLTQREKEIVTLAFGLNGVTMDKEDIAEKFNMGTERVRQIIKTSIAKMGA